MPTMVSFQLIPGTHQDEETIRLLREQGLLDFDGPNKVKAACEPQPLIPLLLAFHPVITLLIRHKLFSPDAPENNVFLPISRRAAQILKISAHAVTPLAAYTNFVCNRLDALQASPDFAAANKGSATALGSLQGHLSAFQMQLADGLKAGQIFVADPRK
jgi:hypothetical protein